MLKSDRIPILLQKVRKATGHTQESLAAQAGISRKHISQIESGKTDPTIGVLARLAAALEVEVKDLIVEPVPENLPPVKSPGSRYSLPIFQEVISGNPTSTGERKVGDLPVQPAEYKESRYILKVGGNSMEPAIHRGDLILVDNGMQPSPRSIITCTINDQSMLVRYELRRTAVVLRAENPSYDPIVVTEEDSFIPHGVVLEIVRRKLR